MSTLHLRLFGEVSLVHEGTVLQNFGTVRAAKLLVLLALARTGRMPRELIAERLWPDDFYDATRLRLRQEIHRLKKALGDDADVIGSSSAEVWLDRAELLTDFDVLEHGATGEGRIDAAVMLDPFLPGWDDPWVTALRNQAEQLQIRAAIAMVTKAIQVGEVDRIQGLLQGMIARHPLNEDLRKLAVEVHAQLGSMTAAVAEFQDYRRKVKEQLGVDAPDVSERLARTLATRQAESQADWSGTVPVSTEPIYGRSDLIARVLDLTRTAARVLTLVGPGGIGKTRLATEVAQRKLSEGERVVFISLAEVDEPRLWVRDALAQLRCDPPAESDPLRFLAATIGQEPILLVLDNLETILPDAAASIAELLQLAPKLKLLITSVTPARVPGEQLIPVGPIDAKEAGLLFLRNALLQYRPATTLDEDNLACLASIAEKLDGYPLALRLASARLRLLSPRDLMRQLDQALARTSAHDLPVRHRSLESALASSFDSLPADLRSLLIRISAYPIGMGMDLCEIAFSKEPYLDAIESLLDLALLTLDDHEGLVRVRMLVPVRSYVQSRLSPEEAALAEDAAVESVLAFVGHQDVAPYKPLSLRSLDLLEAEADNVLFAWRITLEKHPERAYAIVPQVFRLEGTRGRAPALLDSLSEVTERWGSQPADVVLGLELSHAHLASSCHREDVVPTCIERAKAVLDSPDATSSIPNFADWVALIALTEAIYAFRRHFDSAETAALKAIDLAREAGNIYYESRAHRILALVTNYLNRSRESAGHLQSAYDGFQRCGAESELPGLGVFFASTLWFNGEKDVADDIMRKSVQMLPRLRDPVTLAFWHESEGRIAQAMGKFDEAESRFRESLRLWRAIGSPYQEADQLHSICRTLLMTGRWREAKPLVLEAAAKWVQDENYGGLCCTLAAMADVLLQGDNPELAGRVAAFAGAFEREYSLVVVESERQYRARLMEDSGSDGIHGYPVTQDQAKALFDLIR